MSGQTGVIPDAELKERRRSVTAQTQPARRKALASAPQQITAASRRTLEYLIHGSRPQQQGDSAA